MTSHLNCYKKPFFVGSDGLYDVFIVLQERMSFRRKIRTNLEINQAQIKKNNTEIQAQVSVASLIDKRKRVKCPSAQLNQAWIHGDFSIALFIFIIETKLTS